MPADPKLFKYVDINPHSESNTLFKYEYSSIEMIQEQKHSNDIYTDYNIGIRPNMVDS